MEELQLFRWIENSRNSVPNYAAEEKKAKNCVPWNKNITKLSELRSKPFRGRGPTRNSILWNRKRSKLSESLSEAYLGQKYIANSVCWCRIFCITNSFHVIPFCSKLRNWLFHKPLNDSEWPCTFFRGITEIILSLFRGIFSERNSVANPTSNQWEPQN